MKPIVVGLGGDRPESPARRPAAAVDVAPAPPLAVPSSVSIPGGQAAAATLGAGLSPRPARPGAGAPVPPSPRNEAAEEDIIPGIKRRLGVLLEDLRDPGQRGVIVTTAVLVALLLYSYLPALSLASIAWANAQYAHGWIVPLFSVATLFWWRRRATLPVAASARMLGLAVLVASFAVRLFAARFRIVTIDMYTFVPAVTAVFLMVGGWSVIRWAWAPLLFLIFMFPLPDEATRYLLGPLQTIATIVSTFALQTLGLEAFREGNQIILGEMHLGVVDACSGLRMLTIFCALAVGLVMVGQRSWWENGIILASAIPIALLVNSIRITVTGLLYQVADSEVAERVFHDWAGLIMMPMAMAMLYFEQYILSNVFLPETEGPTLARSAAPPAATPATGVFGGGKPAAKPAAARPAPTVVGLSLPGRPVGGAGAAGTRRERGTDSPVIGLPPGGG